MASSSSVEPIIVEDISTSSSDGDDNTDEEGGGASPCSVVEKTMSTLTGPGKTQLEALCNKYDVPSDVYTPRFSGKKPACAPPEDGHHDITVYVDALDAGMRLPLHPFYVELLRHYGLAPSQLAPNSWRYMAAFVLLCEDAQVEPMVSVFQYFFTVCNHSGRYRQQGSGLLSLRGWHHFRPYFLPSSGRSGRTGPLFTGKIPSYQKKSWTSRFFVLRSSVPWPCQLHWGEPSKPAICRPKKLTQEATAAIEKLLQKSTAITGGNDMGIDVMPFLSNRVLPVGVPHIPQLAQVQPHQQATNNVQHTTSRKRKVPADETVPPPSPSVLQLGSASAHHDDHGRRPSKVFGSVTRGLIDLVPQALAEVRAKEQELKATKDEVVQLKLELELAIDGRASDAARHSEEVRLLKEAHAKELDLANAGNLAEIGQIKQKLQRAVAEHEAELRVVKVQCQRRITSLEMDQERYVTGLKGMRQKIALLLPEEAEDLAPSKLTGGPQGSAPQEEPAKGQ